MTYKQAQEGIWGCLKPYVKDDPWKPEVIFALSEKLISLLFTPEEIEEWKKGGYPAIRPDVKIICLCGSTRFTGEMLIKQWELTKQGYVVLSWCALPDYYFQSEDTAHIGDQEGVKELVDEVHKRKIDLSDEVFVLNIGGYIGDSTRGEIEYARKIGKPVKFQEPELASAV